MRITEILSNQEQLNLVRLIMNTTLNALGQPTTPAPTAKSPVVQAVKKNRKEIPKAPKIPAPQAPKPFTKPKPIPGSISVPKVELPKAKASIGPRVPVNAVGPKQSETTLPKRLQPLPTSVYSPINKKPSKEEKKELQDKNDLIDFLKTAQKTR